MGLKEQTIHGSKWEIGTGLISQVIQVLTTTIVARILAPRDFGVYGMALVFIIFLQIFSQLGISSAIVQKKDITDAHLSSVFWLNLLTGIILALAYVASAPFIASFFSEPLLRNIIYILAINFIISSFSIVQLTMLARDMQFKKRALINLFSLIFSGIVAISLAVNHFGVMSLVLASVSQFLAVGVLSWCNTTWRPKFIFDFSKIKEMSGFSLNVLSCDILNFFSRNIQNILVGKFLDSTALGYYSMANQIMLMPVQYITLRISGVTFSAFSKIKHEPHTVKHAYIKSTFFIAVITVPLTIGLFATAPELIITFVGYKWAPVIVLVQILSIAGLLQSISASVGSIMLSQGRPDLQFKWGIFGCSVICTSIIVGLRWGVNGVAICYTLSTIFLTPILMYITLRLIDLKISEFLRSLFPIVVSSMGMATGLMLFRYVVQPPLSISAPIFLLSSVLIGFSVYIFFFKVFFPEKFMEILEVVRLLFPSVKIKSKKV